MRVLIIGSGIAGCVAALALQKAGHDPVVYEAYEHSAGLGQGVFLTLSVNGLDALNAVGAADAVEGLGFPTGKIRFFTGSGKALGAMDIGPRLPDGTVTRSIRRAELYATLYNVARERGIEIQHGRKLQQIEDCPDGVRAIFADGSQARGGILVGADGLRSTVRRLVDSTSPAPRYTGVGNAGGFTRLPQVQPDGGDYRMIWGKRCFFGYTVSPDGECWWFANPPARNPLGSDRLRFMNAAEVKALLVELLEVDEGPAADIVRSTTGDILLGNQYDMPRVPTWHRERSVVIGDAAHAVSPSTGQGVALACEDAVTLALCLRECSDPWAAFSAYEAIRRPRVERVAAWGSKMGGTKTAGPAMRVIRDLLLPGILAKGATPEAMEKQAWMFSHHIDWDHFQLPSQG
jgi:FAD-dependent urate hydroxylase